MSEQGTTLIPSRPSFDRLTAAATWYPGGFADGVGGYSLGVIDTQLIDEGIAREKIMLAMAGAVDLFYEEVVSVAPILTLKGKQWMTTIVPLLMMGSAAAQTHQSSAGSLDITSTAALGKVFDLGARKIISAAVSVATVPKILDVDYFIDLARGEIRFPNVAAGIADGDAVDITLAIPVVNRDTIIAFNRLNQVGDLRLFQTGPFTDAPVIEMLLPGSISRDKGNDGDPVKTNQWALRFALEGTPTILRLADWDELLWDDDSVVEYA